MERPPMPVLRRRLLLGGVLAWAIAITVVVVVRGGDDPAPAATAPTPAPSASEPSLSPAEVYRTLLPSVVRIETVGGGVGAAGSGMAESAVGTGVVANADGTILTAFHVVDGARSVKVLYTDGTVSAATLASSDPGNDIATLTPEKLPETLVPATIGGNVAVGDPVVAIGNPLGLTMSTTSGVVSGLDRELSRDNEGAVSGLIQFDAAVNPGSSGGPLINDRGEVTGIVVSLVNPSDAGTFIGIGFAVPIGTALGGAEGDGRTPPL